MPNGTGMEGHIFTDSEVRDLQRRLGELETMIKLQLGSQDKMLVDRAAKYGPFDKHAVTVQAFWRVMSEAYNAGALEDVHKEGLRMIFHKIGRIVTGDPNYPDSWHDIAGYARRVGDYCTHKTLMQAQSAEPKERYNPSEKIPIISEGEKDSQGFYKP